MKRVLLLGLLFLLSSCSQEASKNWNYLTPAMRVDSLYNSMDGPGHVESGLQLSHAEGEVVWVTGYSARIMDSVGQTAQSQGLMCHNTLLLENETPRNARSPRLFTIAQGQEEIVLPKGFGVPVKADASLVLHSQLLNQSSQFLGQAFTHHISVDYVDEPQKPLMLLEANAFVAESEEAARLNDCSQGVAEGGARRSGRNDTVIHGHWSVPSGIQTNVTKVTEQLQVPYPTTIRYAAAHLHPFAQEIQLRVKGEEKAMVRLTAVTDSEERTLSEVQSLSFPEEGPKLEPGVEYELVTSYNNTSSEKVTAMSILFLYCDDLAFNGEFSDSRITSETGVPIDDDFCSDSNKIPASQR